MLSTLFQLKECPKDNGYTNEKILIKLQGLPDSLEIDLEKLCECDCMGQTEEVSNLYTH